MPSAPERIQDVLYQHNSQALMQTSGPAQQVTLLLLLLVERCTVSVLVVTSTALAVPSKALLTLGHHFLFC
jgi:hypothetical protein